MRRTWPVRLVLLLLAAPAATQAQSGSGDGYDYTINPDNTNTITIRGYTGPGGAVTIPTNINGLLVTSIGGNIVVPPAYSYWFYQAASLTIPGSVTSIEENAFGESFNLISVTIPSSVTNIGELAFGAPLTAIIVDAQNSFYSSTNGVLFDKSQTTLVEYPGGLAGSYTIPGSVTSIEDWA